MDITFFRILFTLVMILVFFGVTIWAFKSSNKAEFDWAAHLPLEDNPTTEPGEQQPHV